MRTAVILASILAASPCLAQSATTLAANAFADCARQKAARFAAVDGDLRSVALAAVAACEAQRLDMVEAYRRHYLDLGANAENARRLATSFVDDRVQIVEREAMAVIAEARTKGD